MTGLLEKIQAVRRLSRATPLAPPLPSGERHRRPSAAILEAKNADAKHRLWREARRVRGQGRIETHLPPHPNPLPAGERERAAFVARKRYNASPRKSFGTWPVR